MKRLVTLGSILIALLQADRAFAQQEDVRPIIVNCFQYFFNGQSPSFGQQQNFNTAWDLPGIFSSRVGADGWFDTDQARFGITTGNQGDCAMWNWVHISNANIRQLIVLPENDATVGHHFDGDPYQHLVSYCPHSWIKFVVFGRARNGYTAVLGEGIKYGTIDSAGPCNGSYSSSQFPCDSPGTVCGNNYAALDTANYPEVWIGMLSWSHDHDHFSSEDPYHSVWWNSQLIYELRR